MLVVRVAEHHDDVHGVGVRDAGHGAVEPLPRGSERLLDALPDCRLLHLPHGGQVPVVLAVEPEAASHPVHPDQVGLAQHRGHHALQRAVQLPEGSGPFGHRAVEQIEHRARRVVNNDLHDTGR